MFCSNKCNFKSILLAAVLFFSAGGFTHAQEIEPRKTIDAAMRLQVIEKVLKQLNDFYVFPEVAKEMEKSVRERMRKKEYDQITDGAELAKKLTSDLQAVSRDKHLWVGYSPKPPPSPGEQRALTAEERERRRNAALQSARNLNYGFFKLERLPGNVGYMDLRQFFDAEIAGEKAAAAMNFLADTDALIIDLRENGGGNNSMVIFLVSYFLEGDPILINTAYFRPGNETVESWTLKNVPGKRYTGKEVYLMTSKETFSAAEEFAYDLQNLKRAVTVGETTGGGANPNMILRVTDHFEMSVPIGRVTNPITKTNWEGTGVKPDIKAPARAALITAHIAALTKLIETTTDKERKTMLEGVVNDLRKNRTK